MGWKISSTGQKTSSLNEDPKIYVNGKIGRFRLNHKLALLLGVISGDSVTLMTDEDNKGLAVFKSIPKTDKAGNILMKVSKLTTEEKEELEAAGEDLPTEIDYMNGCKLGRHLETSSSITALQMGFTGNLSLELEETVDASEVGLTDIDAKVAIFSYADVVESEEEEEEEAEEDGS